MGKEIDRYKHSRRLHRKLAHMVRQVGIRRAYAFDIGSADTVGDTNNPHRYHKLSGMTCGSSRCVMCGNPRKFFNERTIQEKRHMQDADTHRDRHSNGVLLEDE